MSDNKIILPDIRTLTPEAAAAQEITLLTAHTMEWAEYGQQALEAGNAEEVGNALATIQGNLLELLKSNALTPAILQAQAHALKESVAQYTALANKVEVMQMTFNKQVHQGIDEFAEMIYSSDACFDDTHVEGLANEMLEQGIDPIEAEARAALERRLAEARELALEWGADGAVEGPGIGENLVYRMNPEFRSDDWNDDDPDEDEDDLLTDGDDDADDEEN